MEAVRNILIDAINEEKEKSVQRFVEIEHLVRDTDNLPDLFYQTMGVYEHTIGGKETAKAILEAGLTDDFFTNNSKITLGVNGVLFSNKDYIVTFQTNQSKMIHVKSIHLNELPSNLDVIPALEIKNEIRQREEFIPYVSNYLKDKNKINYIALVNKAREYKLYGNGSVTDYYHLKELDWLDELIIIKDTIKTNKERLTRIEKKSELFNQKQSELVEFINSLDNLKSFSEHGWVVRTNLDDEHIKKIDI